MTVKEQLHQVIDTMTDDQAATALALLVPQHDEDPMLGYLAGAPLDDEPLSPEDAAAAREARKDSDAGRLTSLEALTRELG